MSSVRATTSLRWKDYINEIILVPLTLEEIEQWKQSVGSRDYIAQHGVLNNSSSSTPLRMVADRALKNYKIGPSLNNLLPKGPNSLRNQLKVFCR